MSNEDFAARRAAAVAVGLGALGVVMTSIFYALSPPQAALPHPIVSSDAIQATLAGATTMRIAGVIGMHADVLLAAGGDRAAAESTLTTTSRKAHVENRVRTIQHRGVPQHHEGGSAILRARVGHALGHEGRPNRARR